MYDAGQSVPSSGFFLPSMTLAAHSLATESASIPTQDYQGLLYAPAPSMFPEATNMADENALQRQTMPQAQQAVGGRNWAGH